MRHPLLCSFILLLYIQTSKAQSVGIGTTTPDASAKLDVSGTAQGILIPRLSSAQRVAISSPATGLLLFQTDGTPGFYYYTGSAWINLSTGYQANSQGIAASSYGMTSTLAGSGGAGSTDATGMAASFNKPSGLAVDASGNVYVADQYNNKIRKITPDGIVTTFAGRNNPGRLDGIGAGAAFTSPTDVATDPSGNIYVADASNNKIRKITPAAVVTTFAGTGQQGYFDATGTAAIFNSPTGVATDAAGNVYVADQGNSMIRKITPAGVVTTLAGNGGNGSSDGTGTAASFYNPWGVATDAWGNVYVADTRNNKIRVITPAGVVSTLAGNGTAGFADGAGTTASFNYPTSVATDAAGNVYVADGGNNRIRKIAPGGVVSTLAGNGTAGAVDGFNLNSFNSPYGVATDAFGNIYVADRGNNTIRKVLTH